MTPRPARAAAPGNPMNDNLIFDVGLHIGQDTAY